MKISKVMYLQCSRIGIFLEWRVHFLLAVFNNNLVKKNKTTKVVSGNETDHYSIHIIR
jgi:hypothetical protein